MDHHRSIWPNWEEEKLYAILVLGILFIIFLGGVVKVTSAGQAYRFIGQAPTPPRTVTVTGEGKVTSVPDVATVDLGLLTTNRKVAEAQAESTKKMNDLTARLKALGVAESDMKTTLYSIYPRYDYVDGRSVLSGYDVQQTLGVKVRELEKLSVILQVAGEVGLNQIGGLIFTVDDPESLRTSARRKALVNAQGKAVAMAAAVGVRLGPVVSFSETSVGSDQPPYPVYGREGLGAGGATPDVQRGSAEITSTVTLSYEIR